MAGMAPISFDEAMRAEIRRRLQEYQARHRIGVPTLWARVRDADPRKRDFEMKTMQRLLKNEHRTQDAVYDACLLFLTAQDDVPDRLGREMAALFGEVAAADTQGGKPGPPPSELAGTYRVYAQGMVVQPGEIAPEDVDPGQRFDVPYSRMVFTGLPRASWLRAVEYVGNPRRRVNPNLETVFSAATEACTGSVTTLQRTGTYLVALRGFRFNHPKFYLLTDSNLFRGGSPPRLDGHFMDREPNVAAESVFASVRVLLVPETGDTDGSRSTSLPAVSNS